MAQQPWRDVCTVAVWDAATRPYSASRSLNFPEQSAIRIITQTRLQLVQYNNLVKADLDFFTNRASCLNKLASDLDAWLRSNPSVGASNQLLAGLTQLLAKLADQAKLKAGYILKIHNFYTTDATKDYRDPKKLLEYLTKPIAPIPGLAQLSSGCRMEALDPEHRPFEMHFDKPINNFGSPLMWAFGEWMGAMVLRDDIQMPIPGFTVDRINFDGMKPFFIWLEGHEICLGRNHSLESVHDHPENLDPVDLRSVLYSPYGDRGNKKLEAVEGIHWLVPSSEGQIVEMPLDGKNSQIRIFHTGHLLGKGEKETKAAAYVWTSCGTLMAGQHIPQEFHHSSFVAGAAVRSAGMISVINGKVEMISNNSGHYRPSKDNLKEFAKWLQVRKVFTANSRAIVLQPEGEIDIPIAEFLGNDVKLKHNKPSNPQVVADLTMLAACIKSVVQKYSVSRTKGGLFSHNSIFRSKSEESQNALLYLQNDFPNDIETAKLDRNDPSWYGFPKEVIRTLLGEPKSLPFSELLKQVSGRPVFIGNKKFSSLAGLVPLKKSSTMHSILSEEFNKLS